ncbi:MAG TPA: M61 family peptidase [Terracidiphilus sp.]
MRGMRWGVAVAALFTVCALSANAQNITLAVDATKVPQKLLHVEETVPVKAGPVTLYYPKWIPGEHGPDGPVSNITGLKFDADGQSIPWKRDLLDVWTFHVDVPQGKSMLHIAYDYIEGAGFSATDKVLALEWNEVALYPAGTTSDKLMFQAKLKLPDGWKFGTALPVAGQQGSEIEFKPISLELLVDSPVISGEFYRSIDLTPPGEPVHHEIDMVADSAIALNMSDAVQKGLTNVVAESGKLFGARHYREYHFLLTLSDHVAHFGLEHHESNDSRLPERALLEPSAAFSVGGLLPHEFVHSWNGKFRRPADLTTSDFEKPMQDDLLWVYEGLTDYLGPMLAARSGLWTPEQYHDFLASIAAALGPGRPGRTWRPLLDTAVGVPGMRPARGWGDWVRGTDYYDEGDLLWLEVATILHNQTNGAKGIDDFCHSFHGGPNDGPQVKPYTFEQVVATLNGITPYDWAGFLTKHLDSTAPESPVGGIENGGWKVQYTGEALKLPGRRGNVGDEYSIGLSLGQDGAVNESIVGGPAFLAGIGPGMKVVGVNDHIYTQDVLQDAIKSQQPISLLVVIDDYYKTFTVDYRGGAKYPHLVRDDAKPDLLDDLIKARAGK